MLEDRLGNRLESTALLGLLELPIIERLVVIH
jgi:hypothetical protein